MPYTIRHRPNHKKPYVILERGKQVGASSTREKAQASIRARQAAEANKVTRVRLKKLI